MNKGNLSVILVEPQGPLNVGAVCRVMMNFGFNELRLVNPCRAYKSEQARKMALSAQNMLFEAKTFTTLIDALADCHIAFGTTRRFGKYRKNFLTPQPAAEMIAETNDEMKSALVFGREDNGLNTDELALCQHFVTIPTDESFPSMNISHALAIVLYETAKAIKNKTLYHSSIDLTSNLSSEEISDLPTSLAQSSGAKLPTSKSSATIDSIEQMYGHIRKTLCDIEFLDAQNPDHLLRTFRRIFGRAGLTERDVRIIRGLMSKIEWVNNQRRIT